MSERLPYEEQLKDRWDDLTLPNEDVAWKDMKRRLEEDDDERVLIPPYRTGCGIGALIIALLLTGAAWWIVRPERWFTDKDKIVAEEKLDENEKQKEKQKEKEREKTKDTISIGSVTQNQTPVNNKPENNSEHTNSNIQSNESLQSSTKPTLRTQVKKAPITNTKKQVAQTNSNPQQSKPQEVKDKLPPVPGNNDSKTINDTLVNVSNKKDDIIAPADTVSTQPLPTDSSAQDKKPADTASQNKKPAIEPEKRGIFFAAGIGMHQQVPIAGQKLTTYGSLGRIGILSDYIPSIYFKMEKDRRWYIETGFRYGAPQYTKELTYEQQIQIDTVNQVTNITSDRVKKTFYHQVPLAFNYYIKPNWTIGTGIVWNKFHAAIKQRDLVQRNNNSQNDSTIYKNTVKTGGDSAYLEGFSRSWMQATFQTQYQWKRFTFGARYSIGLQPYIRFTLPNSPTQSEKNSSLQIFIKYELWKSKK